MFPIGEIVGLAEWIIDDTCLVSHSLILFQCALFISVDILKKPLVFSELPWDLRKIPGLTREEEQKYGTVSCVLSNDRDIFGYHNLRANLVLNNMYIFLPDL